MLRSTSFPGENFTQEVSDLLRGELDICDQIVEGYRALVLTDRWMPEATRVQEILAPVLFLSRLNTGAQDMDISAAVDGDPPAVLVDPTTLSQCLLMLLASASTASKGDAAITITVSGSEDELLLAITRAGGEVGPHLPQAVKASLWLLREVLPVVAINYAADNTALGIGVTIPSLGRSRRAERGEV